MARWMVEHYKIAKWWADVHKALVDLSPSTSVTDINGVPVTKGIARALDGLIRHVEGDRLNRGVIRGLATGDEVLREATLNDLLKLIVEHWNAFRPKFSAPASRVPLTRSNFEEGFKKVKKARDETYHHKAVSGRPDIVRIAAGLLDHIDVHLGAALDAADSPGPKPYATAVAEEARHSVCRGARLMFRLAAEMFADASSVGDGARLTWHRCATVDAENAAEATRRFLDQMTHEERACAGSIRLLPARRHAAVELTAAA